MKIKFPDNSIKEYPAGSSPLEIAESISPGLARQVITAKIDNKLVDLNYKIMEDVSIELYKFDSEIGKEV